MVIYKKEKNVAVTDLKEYGDIYGLNAIKPDTRLFVNHHEEKRTAEDCIEFFDDIERRPVIDSPIPVFTSDNWDHFEEGLLNVYGFLETPPYCEIGRKPDPVLVPYPNLKYAKVCKKRKMGDSLRYTAYCLWGSQRDNAKFVLVLMTLAMLSAPAFGQTTAKDWLDKGVDFFGQGKCDEAIQHYDKAIEINPQYAAAWSNKGAIIGQQGKYDEALQLFDNAIELNPRHAKAWVGKALVLQSLGRTTEADAAFAKAKELGFAS